MARQLERKYAEGVSRTAEGGIGESQSVGHLSVASVQKLHSTNFLTQCKYVHFGDGSNITVNVMT
jgi:hypothetical protein